MRSARIRNGDTFDILKVFEKFPQIIVISGTETKESFKHENQS